jgi:hypothetical protein
MFAAAGQSVTVNKSSVANGSVSVEAESAGKAVELDCDLGSESCSAPAPGSYVMLKATAEGIYNDCTNVVLYKRTGAGGKEKVGVYCWLNDGVCYMGACDSFAQSPAQTSRGSVTTNLVSPDGSLAAASLTSKGVENRVEIQDAKRTVLCVHDFSSPDGEHGYGVDAAEWTSDSQFVVFRLRSSGGHMPMYAPVVFWSRSTNHFYQLDNYTADQSFSVTSPAKIAVETWPELAPATVSLRELGGVKVSQLP